MADDKLIKKNLVFAILIHSFIHLPFIKYPLKIKMPQKGENTVIAHQIGE